ncbi:flagellar hook-length control protein FliK [Massilia niabensis]|uniref:Flagellar hook-length control protein FliK n=1 Tax=Massilia niabensis TaxID=544910 RepID=A0ABW0LA80_9BURK
MQTTSLPIQVSPSAPAQAPRASAPVPNDGVNFGAALTQQIELRQIEQRQLEQRQALTQPQPNTAPQQALAGPKPQAAARPAANEAKAPAREAHKEPAKESAQAADKADAAKTPAAAEKSAAATAETTDEAPAAPDATVADAVADMLAMVASFNQVQQVAPVVAETMAAQPGALFDALKGKPGDGTEPVVRLDGNTALAAVTDQPKDKAEPGIDLRALDLAKAGDSATLPLETGDFAAKLRDTVAQAVVKEPAASSEGLTSLTAQASALQTAQASGAVPSDRLSARVGTPAWDNQVGQKVIWMVGGEDQSATLELNPPDLGPVQVVLNVSNDMASVTFSSQQLEVRQALENALPRLREMMSESGIALGNATVNAGAEGRQGQDGNGSGRPGGGKGGNGTGGDSAVAEVAPRQRTSILGGAGAVDTFA